MAEKETTPAEQKTPRFPKDQLLSSARYANRKDILTVVLEDGKHYTHAEVEQLVKKFLERKVK